MLRRVVSALASKDSSARMKKLYVRPVNWPTNNYRHIWKFRVRKRGTNHRAERRKDLQVEVSVDVALISRGFPNVRFRLFERPEWTGSDVADGSRPGTRLGDREDRSALGAARPDSDGGRRVSRLNCCSRPLTRVEPVALGRVGASIKIGRAGVRACVPCLQSLSVRECAIHLVRPPIVIELC